jgi:hypothetical protein
MNNEAMKLLLKMDEGHQLVYDRAQEQHLIGGTPVAEKLVVDLMCAWYIELNNEGTDANEVVFVVRRTGYAALDSWEAKREQQGKLQKAQRRRTERLHYYRRAHRKAG